MVIVPSPTSGTLRPSHWWNGPRSSFASTSAGVIVVSDMSFPPSGCDHDLAHDLAVTDQAKAFGGPFQRNDLVDHGLERALLDHVHQGREVVVVEAVRANDLELEAPDIAQVLLRVMAGGRAAGQDRAAALHAFERGHPGVAAGEVDQDIHAALVVAALRLAELGDRPFRE